MTRICILLALLAVTPACDPSALPAAENAATVVDSSAQAALTEAMHVVLAAEPKVEFICEAFPQSRSCEFLTATISKFYAVAVFVQDALDAGQDVGPEVMALVRVAQKLSSAVDTAYRSLS